MTRRAASQRASLANRALVRLAVGHLTAVIGEGAALVAVLVYAFERGGASATGTASIALLTPMILCAPITATLINKYRPQRVRQASLGVQLTAYSLAGVAAFADLPVAFVVAAASAGFGALAAMYPSGAVLLPATVRSSGELTVGILWLGYGDSVSVLAGPLLAAALLALGEPWLVLGGCTTVVAVGFGLACVDTANDPPGPGEAGVGPVAELKVAIRALRHRPGILGVLSVLGVRFALLGALDVLLVVIALESLELGSSGAGLLSGLVGAGALASAVAVTVTARHSRLAPTLMLGLASASALCVLLGLMLSVVTAIIALPLLGVCIASLKGLSHLLLQRSTDPASLGSTFALAELVSGLGLVSGAGFAQTLVAIGGVEVALFGLGIVLGLVLGATMAQLRQADAHSDMPVVEMALLRRLPIFAPLSPVALEAVARTAAEISVAEGAVVITQGEVGDCFYAVADGAFDIVMNDVHIRTATRGGCFGEVALLADVRRTATVSAQTAGALIAIERLPFLRAVTGSDTSLQAAWGVIRSHPLLIDLPSGPPTEKST